MVGVRSTHILVGKMNNSFSSCVHGKNTNYRLFIRKSVQESILTIFVVRSEKFRFVCW